MSYQKWNGYPDSPELTADYPYQFVGTLGSNNTVYLLLSKTKIYTDGSGFLVCVDTTASKLIRYNLSGGLTGSWTNKIDTTGLTQGLSDKQANNDVYTDVTYTGVWLAKTTGIKVISSIALNPLNHKQYIVTMTDKIAPGETPKLGYTKGDVTAVDGGVLENILDFLITNNATAVIPHLVSATTNATGTQVILTFDTEMAAVTGKHGEFGVKIGTSVSAQSWTGFPETPTVGNGFPYQILFYNSGVSKYYLKCSKQPFKKRADNTLGNSAEFYQYYYDGSGWVYSTTDTPTTLAITGNRMDFVNHPVINEADGSTYMAQNTSFFGVSTLPLTSAALDTDPKKVVLSLNIAGEYQKWSGYPDSPVKTSDWPYQMILATSPYYQLIVSTGKFYMNGTTLTGTQEFKIYSNQGGTWSGGDSYTGAIANNPNIDQCNDMVYNEVGLTTVYKAKTTPTYTPAITNGQTVKTSYTKGTVQSATGGALESYADQAVTNVVPNPYQQWGVDGVPASPVSLADYPHQILYKINDTQKYSLLCGNKPYFYMPSSNTLSGKNGLTYTAYELSALNGVWNVTINPYVMTYDNTIMSIGGGGLTLAHSTTDIFTSDTLLSIYFAKDK